jgi:hypothetical protein
MVVVENQENLKWESHMREVSLKYSQTLLSQIWWDQPSKTLRYPRSRNNEGKIINRWNYLIPYQRITDLTCPQWTISACELQNQVYSVSSTF